MAYKAVDNPEYMTDKEWVFFERCELLVSGLIKELHKDGFLKNLKDLPKNQPNTIDTYSRFKKAYNMFVGVFKEPEQIKKFIESNNEFGFDQKNLPYLFVSVVLGHYIIHTEMFRNLILTILKFEEPFRPVMTLNQLFNEIEKTSTYFGSEIKKLFMGKLRNSLVHLTFWIDGDDLYYCDDMKLENPLKINIYEILIEVKKIAILNTCLFATMVNYGVSGKIF